MNDLLQYLTSGHYLAAVGAGLVIIVGLLRAGLGAKWPWFKSQTGGYVLAWGTTTLLFLGTSFEQGQLPSLKLVLQALAAGFAASGIYTHWQDIKDAAKKPPVIGAVTLVLVVLLCAGMDGCGANPPKPIQDAVDCTKADQGQLASDEAECLKKVPDWGAVESCATSTATAHGWTIGTCVVADIVQQYLSSKGAATASQEQTGGAKALLEKVRAEHAGGKSITTKYGAL